MSGYVAKRDGKPHSETAHAGDVIKPIPSQPFLLSYARAWRISGDDELWQATRQIARGTGLGDIADKPCTSQSLHTQTECSDPVALIAMLEIYIQTTDTNYLDIARKIGDKILRQKFRNDLFIEHPGQVYARFDALEPLVLVQLAATEDGRLHDVPMYIGAAARYLQGWHSEKRERFSGYRTSDQKLFYKPPET